MPFFSIIIPVFNKEPFVKKTLKSVLNQSFTDFEIIIVNDGSTDESEAKILSYNDPRIHYFSKLNEGVAIARNFGIEKAQGEFICFLDADDFWHPTFLSTMHSYIQKLPEQKVFATAIEIETNKKSITAQYSIPKISYFEIVNFFDASQKECVLWTSSIAIHKSVLRTVGNFDPIIKKCEDTELWIRIGLNYPIVFIWEILAKYVYDESSISRQWNYFFEPYTFNKYALLEKQNPKLKQYIDLNRFAAVIKCKLLSNYKLAEEIYSTIDLKSLPWKKRILLKMPAIILKILIQFQKFTTNIGLGNSVFR
ncbi:glycosyltransferase family 2 protein [Flavobacterium sp. N1994]|uniref:glycosyltransferase family 2 protein n=1 Tax=Flavobacterium sp. N1994 TaxID=2986827 RepID=UPI0022218C68|nr:glycosyltransferase family A protein [Flavobacterium sp. N1994]